MTEGSNDSREALRQLVTVCLKTGSRKTYMIMFSWLPDFSLYNH